MPAKHKIIKQNQGEKEKQRGSKAHVLFRAIEQAFSDLLAAQSAEINYYSTITSVEQTHAQMKHCFVTITQHQESAGYTCTCRKYLVEPHH